MHPAKSVIAFTTASGAGYGLMFWLGLYACLYELPNDGLFPLFAIGLAIALIVFGLLSSTFHLGHPERAWRALSQWRSSWLSREGVLAILGFIPMAGFGLGWVFKTFSPEATTNFAVISAGFAIATVYATAMIYASLKTIPNWNTPLTVLGYLSISLATGSMLLLALTSFYKNISFEHLNTLTISALTVALLVKLAYWRHIHTKPATSTSETATGLGKFGKVKVFEAPHSSDNYLLKEMGFAIARKHAIKLRRISIGCGFILPLAMLIIAPQSLVISISILLSVAVGVIAERWLFFAEAKHSVTLYYGENQV